VELTPNLHAFLWASPTANNCNTYLIRSPEKSILIDPGHASHFEHVRLGLSRLGMSLEAIDLILCTHAHPDHIEAVGLFNRHPALFALHAAEWRLVQDMAPYMNLDPERFRPNFFLNEGKLRVGDVSLEVFHTPGHSPGAVTLYWPDRRALFTGDLIFNGGLGRTDLPGGNGSQLKDSIRRVSTLEAGWLLSGHGNVISGTASVKANFEQVEKTWFGYI
jgi:hydroxyacylglutathione hydrolase